jgi:uncharacterized protein YqhQ
MYRKLVAAGLEQKVAEAVVEVVVEQRAKNAARRAEYDAARAEDDEERAKTARLEADLAATKVYVYGIISLLVGLFLMVIVTRF